MMPKEVEVRAELDRETVVSFSAEVADMLGEIQVAKSNLEVCENWLIEIQLRLEELYIELGAESP